VTSPKSFLAPLLAIFVPAAFAVVATACAEGRSIPEPPNTCGDGRKGGDEQCDDGAENSDKAPGACRLDCQNPICGDGIIDPGEDCDDGNQEAADGCDANCRDSYVCGNDECEKDIGESCSVCKDDCCPCGDDVCSAGEVCGECPQDCCPNCGNGTLDSGEGCDDGNNAPDDGCGVGCTDEDGVATCGNGLHEAGEACDDGNTEGADGCGADCKLEYICGDNICEGNVGENCITCLSDCCPNCGDGIVNEAEECDGVVPVTVPSCLDQCYPGGAASCTSCLVDYTTCEGALPVCGNGAIECGEVCDDQDLTGLSCAELGFDGGQLRCSSSCELDTGECGALLYYYEASFDDGCPEGWTLNYPWQCGVPTAGPASAVSPPNVLSTGLGSEYPNDLEYFSATATSPSFNLSAAVNPTVSFQIWHDLETNYDAVQILASTNGSAFTTLLQVTPSYESSLQGWDGATSGYQTYSASLLQYVGQPQVYLRFAMVSDFLGQGAGAFIDDLVVGEACGNGAVDPGEACDGANLGGATCAAGTCGTPTCAADCSAILQASCITPSCGDGVRECDEACDEVDFGGGTCDAFGYNGGTLACTAQCELTVAGCGAPQYLLDLQGFETCPPAGWSFTGDWQCGVPTSGPGSAYAGSRVIATNLAGDYQDGWDWNECYAQTPQFTVMGPSPTLAFRSWIRTESSWDGLHLEVSVAGGAFARHDAVTPAYTDTSVGSQSAWDDVLTSWATYRADLSAFSGQQIRVRFAFYSDTSNTFAGAYVDEVIAVPNVALLP
jgi:cysteine-rich repeat protein